MVMRRSTDNGATWAAQTIVRAGNPDTAGNGAAKIGYSDPSFVYDAVAAKLFVFSVYSKGQGFAGSAYGNDDANRSIISAQVSESTDLGLTWGAPQLITTIVKPGTSGSSPQPGAVKGMFASSGEGIQLKYGAYAGRLVQQFAGTVLQADGSTTVQAYSVYSDDHGATWRRGAFVGTGMDENKVVELSNGSLLLNSRASTGGSRKVATSTDGGQTWGAVTTDTDLPDPGNNASITRLFPDAALGSADAAKLLFTNADSTSSRQNVSARVSCDNGATWSSVRPIASGFSAYSTATRLGNGQLGVLYESSYTSGIQFARFSDTWLDYSCPSAATTTTSIDGVHITGSRNDAGRNVTTQPYTAGELVPYSFAVTNTFSTTVTVAPTSGNVSPLVPPGAGNCRYTNLAPGAGYTCSTPKHTVTAAEVAQGYFVPDSTWTVTSASTSTARVIGARVALK
nr:sialidase family protein [Subtercola boreus]